MKALWFRTKYPDGIPTVGKRVIPKQSSQGRKRADAYRRAVADWKRRAENRRCRRCRKPATDCHHIRGRVGALLLDERYWLPVCRRCHEWIGANPREAREHGWIAELGEWGKIEA